MRSTGVVHQVKSGVTKSAGTIGVKGVAVGDDVQNTKVVNQDKSSGAVGANIEIGLVNCAVGDVLGETGIGEKEKSGVASGAIVEVVVSNAVDNDDSFRLTEVGGRQSVVGQTSGTDILVGLESSAVGDVLKFTNAGVDVTADATSQTSVGVDQVSSAVGHVLGVACVLGSQIESLGAILTNGSVVDVSGTVDDSVDSADTVEESVARLTSDTDILVEHVGKTASQDLDGTKVVGQVVSGDTSEALVGAEDVSLATLQVLLKTNATGQVESVST